MIPRPIALVLTAMALCVAATAAPPVPPSETGAQAPMAQPVTDESRKDVPAVLDFEMKRLDGEPAELAQYQGKVILIVNTASRCGLTPQYEALQDLHERYAEQGLAILGFPANDFKEQEPGTDAEIAEFCATNYGVEFDMFSKVVVTGEEKCDLYRFLTAPETNPEFPGEIQWNFEKFLISRDGRIVNRFHPKVKPDAEEVVKAIEAELAKPASG